MDSLRLPQRARFLLRRPSFRHRSWAASFMTVMLMLAAAGTALGQFGGGSGSAADPYLVATPEHLNSVRSYLTMHFRQTADIDLSGYAYGSGWVPIGTSASRFKGSYDGGGFAISNLSIDRPTLEYVGLFGFAGTGASISNVNLDSGTITGMAKVGAIAGGCDGGSIQNCHSGVAVEVAGTGDFDDGGGLVGINWGSGSISGSSSTGTVTGTNRIGGLIGENQGSVSSCVAEGSVQGIKYIGGLIGFNAGASASVSSSEARGQVMGKQYVGGLIGFHNDDAGHPVAECVAVGNVTGTQYVGGLVGGNEAAIAGCRAEGVVTVSGTGDFDAGGGLVGMNWAPGSIINSSALGNVTGTNRIGGFVGENHSVINSCSTRGQLVKGVNYIGGLVGFCGTPASQIMDSKSASTVIGEHGVGGLIGHNNTASGSLVVRSSATGAITGVGRAGGLIGMNYATVTGCWASGTVQATGNDLYDSSGGLVGANGGNISRCFATGSVSGINRTGGLVGSNEEGVIDTCYSTGNLTSSENQIGGIAGFNYLNSTVKRSFANGKVGKPSGPCGWVGGAVGLNRGLIEDCVTLCEVDGNNSVGGLCGENWSEGTIRRCAVMGGRMKSDGYPAGGFISYNEGLVAESFAQTEDPFAYRTLRGAFCGSNPGTILDCYVLADYFNIGNEAGLFAGYNYNAGAMSTTIDLGVIRRCYAATKCSDGWGKGFLNPVSQPVNTPVLPADPNGTVTASFWDSDLCAAQILATATGLPTSQMRQQATFTSAGWDFSSIWTIDEGSSYPYFKNRHFTVTTTTDLASQGTVEPGGVSYQGDLVTLTATPNPGFEFSHWEVDGAVFSRESVFSFPSFRNLDAVAHFKPESTTVDAYSVPLAGPSVSGAGEYENGTQVTLTANESPGYTFLRWEEGGVLLSTDRSISFIAAGDRVIEAHYGIEILAESADPVMGGVQGSDLYETDDTVTLTAIPAPHYHFLNWTENGVIVSTAINYTFAAERTRRLIAHFAIDQYTIAATANPPSGATVNNTGTYDHGSVVTLSATLAPGYHVRNWTENGTVVSTDQEYTFTASADRTLVANLYQHTITTATADPAMGSATGGGYFLDDDSVTVTASPLTGYEFVNWTAGGVEMSTDLSYTFNVTTSLDLVANFSVIRWDVSATSSPAGNATFTGTGRYPYGSDVTLTVHPEPGYFLRYWKEGNTVVSSEPSITINVTKNRSFVAVLYQHEITATPSDATWGSATGGGYFLDGANVTLTATPASAYYYFINWTEDGQEVSTSTTYSFTASDSRQLVANFGRYVYVVDLGMSREGRGSVDGAGSYGAGQEVTVSASADEGFFFTSWRKGTAVVSTNPDYTFTVTGDVSLVANFSVNFAGGSGTEEDPYQVATAEQLDSVRYLPSGYFLQVEDINLGVTPWNEGEGWEPIGNLNFPFTGSYDGGLCEIAGLTIQRPTENYVGLFGRVTGGNSSIRRVVITGADVTGDGSVGALSGQVTYGKFEECSVDASVAGASAVGGAVGQMGYGGIVSGVEVNANVTSSGSSIGGLFGRLTRGVVEDCRIRGSVLGGNGTGGIIGECRNDGSSTPVSVKRSCFSGQVQGAKLVGGLIGYVSDGSPRIIRCHATGDFSATERVGGICGSGTNVLIDSCYSGGRVSGNIYVGGLGNAFRFANSCIVTNSYSVAIVEGDDWCVGISRNLYSSGNLFYSGGIQSAGENCDAIAISADSMVGYWDAERISNWGSNYGAGLSTAQMKQRSTFTDAGWDFENVWGIQEGVTYPYLITIPLDIKVSSADPAQGATSGAKTSYHQLTETVTATPAAGYRFSHWTDYGDVVSTEATYTFQMQTHRDLVAHFVPGHTLSYSSGPGGSLIGQSTQGVDPGGDGTAVQALADAGAHFIGWSDGVMDNPRTDLGVTADLSVTALFATTAQTPIAWYEEHGITPGESETWSDLDSQDADGDGQDNASEHLALTDPKNPGSRFSAGLEVAAEGLSIRVDPVSPERRYTLSHSPDLSPGSWLPVAGWERVTLDPANPTISIGAATDSQGFYRVEVTKP